MSASEKLKALENNHFRIDPIFRKTGAKAEGAEAFTRARDIEKVMDSLRELVAVVETAEKYAADLGSVEAGEVPSECEDLHAALSALDKVLP